MSVWNGETWTCERCAFVNAVIRKTCRNCGLDPARMPMPMARLGDPRTSHDAAHSLRTERLSWCRRTILEELRKAPASDEEIAQRAVWSSFPQSPSSLRTRRAELVDLGLVRDSGRLGLTKSGRKTIIWEAVPVAVEAEQLALV